MRTTIRLNDGLLDQARREATRRGQTLTSLIEQGLRLVLAHSGRPSKRLRVKLPVSRAGGSVLPGVDLNDGASVLDRLEGRR